MQLRQQENISPSRPPTDQQPLYADVVIPLAVKVAYSYRVPSGLAADVRFGVRVEVPFGARKLYAALVIKLHHDPPSYPVKEVVSVMDDLPVVTSRQVAFWQWIADYYASGMGEVMYAAMPAYLKLHSETVIAPGPELDDKIFDLEERDHMIADAVSIQKELRIDQLRSITKLKTVYPLIKKLLEMNVIVVKEELRERYQPKQITGLRVTTAYRKDRQAAFDLVKRSDHQTRALMVIYQLTTTPTPIPQKEVLERANVTHAVIQAMVKKGVLEATPMSVSRLDPAGAEVDRPGKLTVQQERALGRIDEAASARLPVLLHGVTGSGKTRVYMARMRDALSRGEQVLYLLPEIALTAQIVSRLRRVFGGDLLVYHSRINESQRVEVWQKILQGKGVVLGARSSVFLPFVRLGLIIVDEEHDQSYKQHDPSPRYQARDAAMVLAKLHQAQIILGSATPSMESYFNAINDKYRLVTMEERFGGMRLPEVIVADLRREGKHVLFSRVLLEEMEAMVRDGFQVILFQNRRGFAPVLFCTNCGWTTECKNCDTTLTYHKYTHEMRCHICGYREKPALVCPACGNHELAHKGFGTELLEDELRRRLPHFRTARLDLDTARGKKSLERIMGAFQDGQIDVLIGTQMVTKGLDFDRVGLVGIIAADQLIHYPDFRASERAFQLMTQVSGRSGRKERRGRVVIQVYQTTHPIIRDVLNHDYHSFYHREIAERNSFAFPPFSRLIEITLKHTRQAQALLAARYVAKYLSQRLGGRVRGPIEPGISRVRNRYLQVVMVKLEKKSNLIGQTKRWIEEAVVKVKRQKGLSTLRVAINVDP